MSAFPTAGSFYFCHQGISPTLFITEDIFSL